MYNTGLCYERMANETRKQFKTTVQDFLLWFGQDVAEVVTCLNALAERKCGRVTMHKLRTSGNFRMRWKTFRSFQCHIVVHPVLYPRLTDRHYISKNAMGRRITVIRHAMLTR